jgi:hypothetical protein
MPSAPNSRPRGLAGTPLRTMGSTPPQDPVYRGHDTMSTPVPLEACRQRRDAIAVFCRPLEETRTAQNSCYWLAECEIDGQRFAARSRRDAPKELARALVEAGIPDLAMVVSYAGLRGVMRYRSVHAFADWTTVENASTPVRNARFERLEDGSFAGHSDRADPSQREGENGGRTGSVDTPIPPAISPPLLTASDKCDSGKCAGCGRPLEGRRAGARTCSSACRKRVSRGAVRWEAAE